ncbi:MAG: asparagine synthase (glutamine-hydrolyzing) [Verrucomicrobia bacterium]|nr:asparagine synthase (glutamine-hydrolyzing) [Verrucomicrobiota bacterium]
MCGIAGWIDPAAAPDTRDAAVSRMCEAMVHRGPDDAGIASLSAATLGMRRLAIFDPANGHQPMVSPDARLTLVFNGAIYNFRALRDELAGGWQFRTQCDTEVLLAAFARWGEACLGRLRGMFAFAVWDERERTLFLARDPFGIKPLYYRHDGQRLLFASELNALLAAGAFPAELDPLSVADFLAWLAVPVPRSIYRDVFSLRPGECATFRAGRLDIRSAWSFRSLPADVRPCASAAEFSCELRARLDDSIRAHVVADVPVGAFLSGGLDSAIVTGLMARATGAQLKTFSIVFDESEYSEAGHAAATARHLGTSHHESRLTGAAIAADLERIVTALDQPTGDGINTYYASRAARAGGVTVALSGLGGDELFGGYPSFRNIPRFSRALPWWWSVPEAIRHRVVERLRHGDTRQQKLADVLAYARTPHELGALQRRVFSETTRLTLLAPDARAAVQGRSPFHPELPVLSADLAAAGPFETASAWELRTYMTDVLLRDSDVMSMRHSLELRVPFVDRPLIDWLWRQPAEFKGTPRHPKSALYHAARDLLPADLARRPKWGFTLPFPRWMKHELRPFLDETFADASVDRSGLFDRAQVQALWRDFNSRDDTRQWSRVWSLAVLVAFANRRSPAAAPAGHRALEPVVQSARPASPSPERRAPPSTPRQPPHRPRTKPRSRTLLLAPEIFASEGGIARILQAYLKALCDLAPPDGAVRLLALNDPAISSSDLRRSANDRLEDWFACSRDKTRFVRAALRLSRGCDRLICGHVAQLPIAWLVKRLRPRLRYFLVAHGIEVWRPFNFSERVALRGAERILCVSDFTRGELLRHCPLPAGRAVVLPNALDPCCTIAPGRSLAECPPVILVVTRLSAADRYKGVDSMIEAMPAIRAAIPAAQLRIVGRGDDLSRLQALRARLGLANAVEFLGYVDDNRLDHEFHHCRLFALPSGKEGFGLVFLEAMARGRPCLGARAGGVPEVITPETGVLVDYGDVPGIAAACTSSLARAWSEPAILARAGDFSFSKFTARLAELIR